ncbi:MAG: YcfL family protein [Verrucomicrobia bacterium]|nr:YcfL family protein [Verrucomicrobiota bacterium]
MKSFLMSVVLIAATGLAAGCSKQSGALMPQPAGLTPEQTNAKFVLMDPGAQYSVTSTGLMETRLPDGRLQVACQVLNRENRRIQVQIQCVFKDAQGFSTGDETPWDNLILTENATETVKFTSLNNQAASYTVRVRQAR